ncbi:MAG: tetratricopeptide repeat protein [Bacteroidetes bacterium]|nr:tetratricopeptide repeat protein [Bacteroidota bacterium]
MKDYLISQHKILAFVIFFMSIQKFSLAQKDAQAIYDGNKFYKSGDIEKAALEYRKSLQINAANKKANYNLGSSIYRAGVGVKEGKIKVPLQKKMTPDSLAGLMLDEAAQNFAVVANSISSKDTLHNVWHNIGNCYLKKKDYQQAVDAYKKSLKLNPKDEDTRYNLAYALKNMPPKQNKGGGGQNNQNKKEEDKKDKQKNADPKPNDMDKNQAEQLLKALMNKEQKLHDNKKMKQEDPSKTTVDKDW